MGKMVSIDEGLLAEAGEAVGTDEAEAIVMQALRALIAREAGRRLAAMGGTMPGAWAPNEGDEPAD